jgi:hypothetical protein
MSGRHSPTGSRELEERLKALGEEITVLHRELSWMALQSPSQPLAQVMGDLDIGVMTHFKSTVDSMRDLVWKYLDAAAKVQPERVHDAMDSEQLLRGTQLQQLLRERLVYSPVKQAESFVDTISLAIQHMLEAKTVIEIPAPKDVDQTPYDVPQSSAKAS